MAWTTSVEELRALLHDGPTDKLRNRKRVFGELNGTNKRFKTLEYRRVTDFTDVGTVYPFGVWLSGVLLLPAAIATDFPSEGDFELVTAPVDGDVLEASYYIQWFTDAELQAFLVTAARWLEFPDQTTLSICLQQSALKYAASEAYQKLASKFMESISETYRLEDQPKTEGGAFLNPYKDLADQFYRQATKIRDDCYSRAGKSLAPSWGFAPGRVKDPQPKS